MIVLGNSPASHRSTEKDRWKLWASVVCTSLVFAGKLVITIRSEYEWAASELPFHIPIWNAVRKESKGYIVDCYLTIG